MREGRVNTEIFWSNSFSRYLSSLLAVGDGILYKVLKYVK